MSIDVRAIELPRDAARFCRTWWPIYANDPHWVPPLLFERERFLDPGKNPFFQVARVQCFMASRGGTPVAPIAATIEDAAQEREPGVGFFGFFEFPDDLAVSRALVETAAGWLRDRGMDVMRGPYSLSPNHEFGLRVDGWDTDPAVLNPHNRDYYARHYEALGLVGVRDWYAYWLDHAPVPERLARAARRFLESAPGRRTASSGHGPLGRGDPWFWDIYNDGWEHNWGHTHITHDEFVEVARGLREMADPELIWWAFVDGEPAAAVVAFPDYNQVAKRMNGRRLPFGWYHWLFGRRRIDALRIFTLGVKQRYQGMPLGAPLYLRIWEAGLARGWRGADASLVLEDNVRMRGSLEKLGARIYQTYRIYECRLDGRAGKAPSDGGDVGT